MKKPVDCLSTQSDQFYEFLIALKDKSFTGVIELIKLSSGDLKWHLHFCMGRLFFVSGGRHPQRRLYRQILTLNSDVQPKILFNSIKTSCHQEWWDYRLLCQWVDRNLLTPEQINHVLKNLVMEVIFDCVQAQNCQYLIHQDPVFSRYLIVLDPSELIPAVQQNWQRWQQAQIADCLPDHAPAIRQLDLLQQQCSATLYRTLTQLLNGQRTLRDLAVLTRRSSLEVTASIAKYLRSGAIELIAIKDLIGDRPRLTAPAPLSRQPLIACIDDSAWICQSLEQLITAGGYRFLAIHDPAQSITQLLREKPDLIFLDLRMPKTNGYEICAQLRKLSLFQNKPIIILTGQDGLVDRMRAKMVGATDFLSKSANDQTLLSCIQKYLNSNNFSPSSSQQKTRILT